MKIFDIVILSQNFWSWILIDIILRCGQFLIELKHNGSAYLAIDSFEERIDALQQRTMLEIVWISLQKYRFFQLNV